MPHETLILCKLFFPLFFFSLFGYNATLFFLYYFHILFLPYFFIFLSFHFFLFIFYFLLFSFFSWLRAWEACCLPLISKRSGRCLGDEYQSTSHKLPVCYDFSKVHHTQVFYFYLLVPFVSIFLPRLIYIIII